jgi:hypothetical protein
LAQYIIALIGNEERNDSLKSSLESKLNEFFDDRKFLAKRCENGILTMPYFC